MNFHKTIGFLATLLLVFGLGVPDSFAQAEVKSITLSLNKTTLNDSTSTQVTVVATVGVMMTKAVGEDSTIAVGITVTDDNSYSASGVSSIDVIIPAGKDSKSGVKGNLLFDFTTGPPRGDADTDDETVTVTAQHTGADAKATKTLTVRDFAASLDNNATTPRGYRVVISAPKAGVWARAAKDQIKVQVLRKDGLAAEFGAMASIKVSLYHDVDGDGKLVAQSGTVDQADGTDAADAELYSLLIDDDVQLSTLAVPRIKTKTLTGTAAAPHSDTAINSGNTKAYYTRRSGKNGWDKLEFRFQPASGGGPFDNVYAVVDFGFTTVVAPNVNKLDNRDTKTSIYPPSPDAFSEKIGDGKTIKIDPTGPGLLVVQSISVAIDKGDPLATDAAASEADLVTAGALVGIGKTLKITVNVNDFTDHQLQLQIRGRVAKGFPDEDGTNVDVTGANQPLVGFGKTYDALTVIQAVARGEAITHEVKVTEGMFKRKANLKAHPDGKTFKKNGTYQDDNVIAYVKAVVKDAAGNAAAQTNQSLPFLLDSKPPVVTIEYPKPSVADSARFTEKPAQDVSDVVHIFDALPAPLKPLRFKSNEKIANVTGVNPADQTDSILVIIGAGAAVDTLVGEAHKNTAGLLTLVTGDDPPAPLSYDLSSFIQKNAVDKKGTNKKNAVDDAGEGGKEVDLKVVTQDLVGNKGMASMKAIFDGKPPEVSGLFPNNTALADGKNVIGDGTQHPVFQINEVADSILVRYDGDSTLDVAGTAAQLKMVKENIKVMFTGKDDSLRQGEIYNLQVYVRDLAGHVGVSTLQENLTFDNAVNNPEAGGFKIAAMDSVVAGQPMALTVTAIDTMLSTAKKDRAAVTYAKAGVMVVAMGSDGEKASGATFYGKGVTDNEDGSATLGSGEWSIGVHKLNVILKNADDVTIVAKDMTADGVLNFSGETMVTVDAADFAQFNITAMEDGAEVQHVWGDFTLEITPADRYGNPSVKAYKDGADDLDNINDKGAITDSLSILDTRLKAEGFNYKNGFDVTLRSLPDIGLPPFEWTMELDDEFTRTFAVTAPADAKQVALQVRVDNTSLMEGDTRSQNVKTNATIKVAPHSGDSKLALKASASEVTITPGNESASATVTASGEFEGKTVTFDPVATEGSADDFTHSQEGNVLTVTATGDVTVSVTATDGVKTTEAVMITFDKQARMTYSDADGNPVYLISDDNMTVDTQDFIDFVAAYGSSAGDDNYNLQADVNDDGMVDINDFLAFISSYGRTAVDAATKPLVLLPGINENAEFSLSLGSERVIPGELVAVDVSLANVEALIGYGFVLNYESDKFEFVSAEPANEDLLKSTGGETPLFKHWATDGQITIANGLVNGTAVSGGGDIVRFTFRVLREFEENARFEVADGLVFDPQQLQNVAVVAGVLELQSTPMEFALHQNFPNPFNPDTTIKYDLAESADVTLQIYNVLGQVIRTLVAGESQVPGRYQIRWNGMDDRGVSVSSGVYFYRISADKFQDVRKLMLLK